MLFIQTSNVAEAWQKCFIDLYLKGRKIPEKGFYKNESAAIEIFNVNYNLYDLNFPMTLQEIELTNEFLVTGKHKEKVNHEWTKLYRHRLFERSNQISKIIDYLNEKPYGNRAQASVWDDSFDFETTNIAPCLQILWFKILDEQLELHVHMRANDCYGKLLMNINEFVAIQKYISQELGIPTGKYIHFVDSMHFHLDDQSAVDSLFKTLQDQKVRTK